MNAKNWGPVEVTYTTAKSQEIKRTFRPGDEVPTLDIFLVGGEMVQATLLDLVATAVKKPGLKPNCPHCNDFGAYDIWHTFVCGGCCGLFKVVGQV